MSDDVVLSYLNRLRSMTDSPRLLGDIDEIEAERIEELAQRRGEDLVRKMAESGELKARSPKVYVPHNHRVVVPGCFRCEMGPTSNKEPK